MKRLCWKRLFKLQKSIIIGGPYRAVVLLIMIEKTVTGKRTEWI